MHNNVFCLKQIIFIKIIKIYFIKQNLKLTEMQDWKIILPSISTPEGGYTIPNGKLTTDTEKTAPLSAKTQEIESWFTSISSTPIIRGYYWSAPAAYKGNQITAYRNQMTVILKFNSPTMLSYRNPSLTDQMGRYNPHSIAMFDHLSYMWLNEPDIVLEV